MGPLSNFNLEKLGQNSKENKDNLRENDVWLSPPNGWIKANFDGASKGNPGKARCGGVLRDYNCNIIRARDIPLGITTSHKAEMTGAHYMIKLARDTKCRNLWLEGDSKNIVNILNEKNDPAWDISNLLRDYKNDLNFFHKVFMSHNYRETNTLANWMANLEIKSNDIVMWTDQLRMDDDLKVRYNYERNISREGKIHF